MRQAFDPSTEIGKRLDGGLRLVEIIASGSFAVVMRAVDETAEERTEVPAGKVKLVHRLTPPSLSSMP
jgi:hypothetical protein